MKQVLMLVVLAIGLVSSTGCHWLHHRHCNHCQTDRLPPCQVGWQRGGTDYQRYLGCNHCGGIAAGSGQGQWIAWPRHAYAQSQPAGRWPPAAGRWPKSPIPLHHPRTRDFPGQSADHRPPACRRSGGTIDWQSHETQAPTGLRSLMGNSGSSRTASLLGAPPLQGSRPQCWMMAWASAM